jgi:hypothetical protein
MSDSVRRLLALGRPRRSGVLKRRGLFGLALCLGLAALVVAPTVALAANSSEGSPVNCQAQVVRTNPVFVSTPYFVTIPGLSVSLSPLGPMTITVSGTLSGQPADFEVIDTWSLLDAAVGRVTPPGPAIFTPPPTGGSSFSFTWVDSGKPTDATHVLRVLWKRASHAGAARLAMGDVVVTFDAGRC